MEKLENLNEKKFGVLGSKIENNHYVVSLRWKDGQETGEHFPVKGFSIVDPATGKKWGVGHIDGKKALKILEENAAKMTADEFSWRDFL